MRLIDADAYAKYINKVLKQIEEDTSPINPDGFIIATSIVKGIEEDMKDETITPTIDAEPVIHCKDCKHNSLKRMSGNTYCDLGIGLFQLYDFCSLGERRTDERPD